MAKTDDDTTEPEVEPTAAAVTEAVVDEPTPGYDQETGQFNA